MTGHGVMGSDVENTEACVLLIRLLVSLPRPRAVFVDFVVRTARGRASLPGVGSGNCLDGSLVAAIMCAKTSRPLARVTSRSTRRFISSTSAREYLSFPDHTNKTNTHWQTDKRQSGHTNIAEVSGNKVSFLAGAGQTLGLEYCLNLGNLHLQPTMRG
jgi:hypothetical protein